MTTPTLTLRDDTSRSRRRQQYLGIGLLVVVLVGVFAVYLPNRKSLEAIREQIATIEREASQNAERVRTLPTLIAEVKNLRNQVDRYKPLLGRSDVEHAMDEIGKVKDSTLVGDYGIKTLGKKERAICIEEPLQITFTANFVDAMSLIQRIEAMDRLTRMRELTIRSLDSSIQRNKGTVSVSMKVSLFYSDAIQ